MGHALAQVVLANSNGVPEDVYVNTFHFNTAGGTVTPTNVNDIITEIDSFYNTIHAPGVAALAARFSHHLSSTATVKIYDMGDPIPRVPLDVANFTLALGGTTSALPEEIALCLSYKADPVGGIPLRQLRGRIYVGPFEASAGTDAGSANRPTSSTLNAMAGAGSYLSNVVSSVSWSVFSAAALAGGDPDGLFTITQGFVDDAWDTQRRRGVGASVRQTWT